MRKYISVVVVFVMFLIGCDRDRGLSGLLTDMDRRIAALEKLCTQLNTNIEALRVIVESEQTGDYITNISPIMEGGQQIGYTITFAQHGSITIYNGHDGKDGTNGIDGTNGKDGQDGVSPVVGG